MFKGADTSRVTSIKSESTQYNTLLVDDSPEYCEILQDYLTAYSFEFTVAHDGKTGIETAINGNFDVIILDMFLPDMYGLEVLKTMRQHSQAPIVVLSAHNDETDRIVALELGADDYVPKSSSPRELLARLRAVIRRSTGAGVAPAAAEGALSVGDITINKLNMEVLRNGEEVALTHIEFHLLYRMAKEPGRVFSRENLLSVICDRDFCSFDRSIDMHISSLRRKLGDDSRSPEYVKTIRGSGYSFVKKPRICL